MYYFYDTPYNLNEHLNITLNNLLLYKKYYHNLLFDHHIYHLYYRIHLLQDNYHMVLHMFLRKILYQYIKYMYYFYDTPYNYHEYLNIILNNLLLYTQYYHNLLFGHHIFHLYYRIHFLDIFHMIHHMPLQKMFY